MKGVLLYLWQLPQHVVGLVLIAALRAERAIGDGVPEYWKFERKGAFSRFMSGVSLGRYILLADNDSEDTVCHEWGHSRQSAYLGWFYLLVVGIYSAVFCNWQDRVFHKGWALYDRLYWYYKTRWCERWADLLGGVDRDSVLAGITRPHDARYPAVKNQRKAGKTVC